MEEYNTEWKTLGMKQIWLVCCVGIFISTWCYAQNNTVEKWGTWATWGDTGNGTYQNPILPADFSDIDCIRVGVDYYAISSTNQFSPGMVIITSKDLVNWKIAGHAIDDLTKISPAMSWQEMDRYGKGVWAGSIRYHKGKFYVVFGTPDEGYFITSATNPAGKWSPLTPLLSEPGWDDCSMLWDDDGKVYFVGTQFSDGKTHVYRTYLFRMSDNGMKIDRSSALLVNEGSGREANKLIKKDGMYYLIYSRHMEGIGRYVTAKRSTSIFGKWSEEKQLALTSSEANSPNQGGIVQIPNGEWYFLTHHGKGDWEGRAASLLPVTWIEGWPIIGKVLPEKLGTMSWGGKKPIQIESDYTIQKSDEFDRAILGPQWEWNYQPRKDKWSLSQRKGWLRLSAFRPLEQDQLAKAGNTLTQRTFRTAMSEVIVKMDLRGMADGQKAGLSHFGFPDYSAIGITCRHKIHSIELNVKGKFTIGETVQESVIWLKSTWGTDGISQYSYSLDGKKFVLFGPPYQMKWGSYRGDRIGIYCYNNLSDSGYVDVDFLNYTIKR
jgi:beta-xylosidase